MGYSLADIKTKALIYNTLEQKVENLSFTSDNYIKIISFDKTEEPYYNATVDLLMVESDKVTKASIKISNNYVEFFDCESDYEMVLNKQIVTKAATDTEPEINKDIFCIKFVTRSASNSRATITTNTQVHKGIMTLDPITTANLTIDSDTDNDGIVEDTNGDGIICKDVLSILPGYARALPDNYLTSVSGLTVKIEGNDLIIS